MGKRTRSDQRSTPGKTLAGQDTLPLVANGAVAAKEPANLSAGDTNITSGDIGLSANVLAELAHESNAEASDLVVRLALGVEVGTTLATTHAHCRLNASASLTRISVGVQSGMRLILTASQSILEGLLEAEELKTVDFRPISHHSIFTFFSAMFSCMQSPFLRHCPLPRGKQQASRIDGGSANAISNLMAHFC